MRDDSGVDIIFKLKGDQIFGVALFQVSHIGNAMKE